jgi:hypothetical protein
MSKYGVRKVGNEELRRGATAMPNTYGRYDACVSYLAKGNPWLLLVFSSQCGALISASGLFSHLLVRYSQISPMSYQSYRYTYCCMKAFKGIICNYCRISNYCRIMIQFLLIGTILGPAIQFTSIGMYYCVAVSMY